MKDPQQLHRDQALLRYHIAVTTGDMDTACAILASASEDPALQRQLLELEDALAAGDAQEEMRVKDRALVQDLLARHLSSDPEAPPPPLTVGQVAARMQADRQVNAADEAGLRALMASTAPLPGSLGLGAVRDLLGRLGAATSDRFQRLFHHTAVLLGLGNSEAQAAYARRQARVPAPDADRLAGPPPGEDPEGTP